MMSRSERDLQAVEWCLTLAEGELDGMAHQDFEAWIADGDNAAALDDALRVWRVADQAADLPEVLRLRQRGLKAFQQAQGQRWRHHVPPLRWVAVAAAVGGLIVLSAMFYTPTQVYRTGVGERQVAMLADGSRLSLDADTEVRVRLGGSRRDLTLARGRAKFDVARDPLRPFAVTAGAKVVVATGTSFSVELIRREARVLLYEGHVALMDRTQAEATSGETKSGRDSTATYTALQPGREYVARLDLPPSAPQVTVVDPVRSLSWEAGQLNFEDEPLSSALERVNRYSRRKVRLSDPRLGRLPVNGVFEAGDVDAFVEAMTAFNGLHAIESDDGVTLRPF
ncbi:FecR domain-containing protein [Brevundimonas vesicularis]|uniref:FecR family protein n=1 Tax=Brevundimonas vesicularis TaxID=41276 RepID=UPI0022EC5EDA|nr:FecR domain-containing protein [Brevundimonas vesicularis]WBT06364.1 FecR domain-containing protein [Brevundimonas vesicularis]